jgi:hypothetical protein
VSNDERIYVTAENDDVVGGYNNQKLSKSVGCRCVY